MNNEKLRGARLVDFRLKTRMNLEGSDPATSSRQDATKSKAFPCMEIGLFSKHKNCVFPTSRMKEIFHTHSDPRMEHVQEVSLSEAQAEGTL